MALIYAIYEHIQYNKYADNKPRVSLYAFTEASKLSQHIIHSEHT